MFNVDEASLRIFSSVSKDDRLELENQKEGRDSQRPISTANARLNFSEDDSGSEKRDTVANRDMHLSYIFMDRPDFEFEAEDYKDQNNMSDFFVQKDYKGIRGRRNTIQPLSGKKERQSSRTSSL